LNEVYSMITLPVLLEIITVLFSSIYLFLLVKENIWCWPFAILSSLLSIYLFVEAKLYSEAFLYFFYILFGIYGWYKWSAKENGASLSISKLDPKIHALWIGIGIILAFVLGYLFQTYTDAEKSFIDSNTTIFSFIASYLEAHKYLYAWIYWIILNAVSVWLYFTQGLTIYAGLMVVYFIMSGVGLWNWSRKYREERSEARP